MPRFTLFRLIKSFFLFWLGSVGVWLFLPSPVATGRDDLIQTRLTSGQVLHTVHKWDKSYASPGPNGHVRRPDDDCAGLLIDWQLAADAQEHHGSAVLLNIGERSTVNLTHALLKAAAEEAEATGDSSSSSSSSSNSAESRDHNALNGLYISEVLNVLVRAGDDHHIINMPWFRWADMALFHNQMHRFRYTIELQLVAHQSSPPRVEVWKASSVADMDASQLLSPRPADRESGLLASFADVLLQPSSTSTTTTTTNDDNDPYAVLTGVHITDVKGDLPSLTYPIRSFMLIYLAPFLTICLFIAEYLAFPILTFFLLPLCAIYLALVFLCWCYFAVVCRSSSEYNGFREWRASFWLTSWWPSSCSSVFSSPSSCCSALARSRRKRRRKGAPVVIWGPTGPVYEPDRNETDSLVGSFKRGR